VGLHLESLNILPSINKCLIYQGKKIIRVDFCSIAKELKFDTTHHHAHPSSGVLATLTGMKRSGNTASYNTPVRI
jgi:hypothetical protein